RPGVHPYESGRRADTHAGARCPQQAVPPDVAGARVDAAAVEERDAGDPAPYRRPHFPVQHQEPIAARDAQDRVDLADGALAVAAHARRAAGGEPLGADQVLPAEAAADAELLTPRKDNVAILPVRRLLVLVLREVEVATDPPA